MSLMQTQAPGLFGQLRRAVDPAALAWLESMYEESIRRGGLEESPVIRPEGASFNPRPARVCRILLDEEREVRPALLSAALLAPARDLADLDLSAAPLARDVHRLRNENGACDASAEAWLVYLAFRLDELRHLHMSTLSPEARRALVAHTRAVALPRSGLHDTRIGSMIQSWLDRHGPTHE